MTVAPVLPGTLPVLRWFAAERAFAGPTCVAADPAAKLRPMSPPLGRREEGSSRSARKARSAKGAP